MPVIINGSTGISGVDGSVSSPAVEGSDTDTGLFFPAAGAVAVTNNGTESVRFNSVGQMEIKDGTALLPTIAHSGDLNTGIFFPAADTIAFATSGAERVRLDSSGNLGVGTASPDANLTAAIASFGDGAAATPSIAHAADLNTGMFFPAADNIGLTTAGSERFRFGSAGQLGIGGATYGTSGQSLLSGGASAAPTWGFKGMTLLGTLTTTSGATQTLSSLTLTGYRALYIVVNGVSSAASLALRFASTTGAQIASNNGATESNSGFVWYDLLSGAYIANVYASTSTTSTSQLFSGTAATGIPAYYGRGPYTTASTSIVFSSGSASAFDAGSIDIYGVA